MQPAPSPHAPGQGLSASDLISGVLELLRAHPVPLLAPLLILGVLGSGGGGGGGGFAGWNAETGGAPPWELLPFLLAFGLVALVIGVIVFLLYGVAWLVTTEAALTTLQGRGQPDLGAAWRTVQPLLGGGLVTYLLWILAIVIGLILLVVPGIIAMIGLVPWAAVYLAERRSGTDALGRSWELTKGHKGDLFLLLLAAFGISIVSGILVGWIPLIGGLLSGIVSGAVNAASAVLGALYYHRRTAGAASGPGPATGAPPTTAPPAMDEPAGP